MIPVGQVPVTVGIAALTVRVTLLVSDLFAADGALIEIWPVYTLG